MEQGLAQEFKAERQPLVAVAQRPAGTGEPGPEAFMVVRSNAAAAAVGGAAEIDGAGRSHGPRKAASLG